ncbi:MAG TPA: c-type cytochrome [Burkholderiaceae bacterium]|nr:c-type cytochrome [Burkholderiaceae bacterium]
MKKVLAVALVGALFSGSAMAQLELAKQKNCLACHSVDKKVLGPAYKDVAAKYANDPGAEAHLVKKVREGGTGVWGKNVMPANPKLSEEDATSLVKWILSLK